MIRTSRRTFMAGATAFLTNGTVRSLDEPACIPGIEATLGGRIGVSALDTGSGREVLYRADERFAMCSTFKAALAAAVLMRIERGDIRSDETFGIDRAGLLPNSPVTKAWPDGRIGVIEACEAIVSYSDNSAANLLLEKIGGPPAMTVYFRQLDDDISRLDRYELELNSNIAGDPRDTTTPLAMAGTLRCLLLRDALASESRDLLTRWMINEQNGRNRIRAGLPKSWLVANKPGTSSNGATNDIGVAWPPAGAPIVFAVFVNAPDADGTAREHAIAEVARSAVEAIRG